MDIKLAFDIYGTLIDPSGVNEILENFVGSKAIQFSTLWRRKQIEYSFRRGLMRNYRNFSVCTKQALEYTCDYFYLEISEEEKQGILDQYLFLPAFPGVEECLDYLKASEIKLYAFSNGTREMVDRVLGNAGIHSFFTDIISTDEIHSFKPDPDVYNHFLSRTNSTGGEAWLVSSNPFDVVGAISAGIKSVWIKRKPDYVFDPWEIKPTITLNNISELSPIILKSVIS